MKKTLLAIAAASMIVPTAAQAYDRPHGNYGQYVSKQAHKKNADKKRAQAYYKFRKGERFDRSRATNYRKIDYRQYRDLRAPPRGYEYVRSGDDVLLVAIGSGIIGAVIGGLLF